MQTHIVEMPTVKLLKTMCHLNKHTMYYWDMAIVDISVSTMFLMKRFDGEELKFICKVIPTLDMFTK